MCFRPPTAQKPVKCEECGAVNPQSVKVCRKCKAELGNKASKEEEKE